MKYLKTKPIIKEVKLKISSILAIYFKPIFYDFKLCTININLTKSN